jgi:hypothetical protein
MSTETAEQWRVRYDRHIRSAAWKNLKAAVIKLRGNKRERCPFTYKLTLHHKTYDRFACERLDDVELLCNGCHLKADLAREESSSRKRAQALETAIYNNGLDTYATKKYGDGWDYRCNPEIIADEFDRWLERKQERDW